MRRAFLLSLVVAVAPALAVPKPDDTKTGKVELQLVAPAKALFVGDPFNLKFAFKNGTDRETTVIRPLDGSECGWRRATYTWEVSRNGQPVTRGGYGRCGNVNPLVAEDFLTIPAGKTLEVAAGFAGQPDHFYQLNSPGTYTIRLIYKFDPNGRDKGSGAERVAGPLKAYDMLPAVEMASEPVVIEVQPLTPQLQQARAKLEEAKAIATMVWERHNMLISSRTGADGEEAAIREAKTAMDDAAARVNKLKAEFEQLRRGTDPTR